MARFEYGDSIKGTLFQTIHDLCAQEMGISMPERERHVQWVADDEIFDDTFKLNPVNLKFIPNGKRFMVTSFTLELPTDEILSVRRGKKGREELLEHDPFTIGVLQTMQKLTAHPHKLCKERRDQYAGQRSTRARSGFIS